MKKFKTPLAISGTTEQLTSLMSDLVELGYSEYQITPDWNRRPHLITRPHNSDKTNWHFTNLSESTDDYIQAIKVSANDKDLVLALAAMVDDDKFYKGEFVLVTNGGAEYALHIVDGNKNYLIGKRGVRKATVEEIINYFKQDEVPFIDKAMNTKKIVAYQMKKGVSEAILRAAGLGGRFVPGSHSHSAAIQAGVIDLLYEPVYEKEKKFIEVEYEKKGKTLKVELTYNKKIARIILPEGTYEFTKHQLQELFKPIKAGGVQFIPTYFNVGCNEQYKNVSAEGIIKVIDALSN